MRPKPRRFFVEIGSHDLPVMTLTRHPDRKLVGVRVGYLNARELMRDEFRVMSQRPALRLDEMRRHGLDGLGDG